MPWADVVKSNQENLKDFSLRLHKMCIVKIQPPPLPLCVVVSAYKWMACYHPLKGYRSRDLTEKGKRKIVFKKSLAYDNDIVTLPCGQCVGCRLERSRQWAIRCVHESQTHEENCFITLTYSEDNLPKGNTLIKRDYQLFMKKLRRHYAPKKIRFFQCGEYGEKYGRPHYHACLFGLDFEDKKLWKESNENPLYTSETLNSIWGHGYCVIGEVTFESAAYVARYVMKKITGKKSEETDPITGLKHYDYVDENGEVHDREPEYTTMSRKPGIGKSWYDKYKNDVYPHDFVILNGKKVRPPKYYDTLLDAECTLIEDGNALIFDDSSFEFEELQDRRKASLEKNLDNNTHERLIVREQVQIEKFNKLVRKMDMEN